MLKIRRSLYIETGPRCSTKIPLVPHPVLTVTNWAIVSGAASAAHSSILNNGSATNTCSALKGLPMSTDTTNVINNNCKDQHNFVMVLMTKLSICWFPIPRELFTVLTHICVAEFNHIGLYNGVTPAQLQAINADRSPLWPHNSVIILSQSLLNFVLLSGNCSWICLIDLSNHCSFK